MSIINTTQQLIYRARTVYPEPWLVAFSGGKDSWCVLDVLLDNGVKVQPFFWYIIKGLACEEFFLNAAEKRYGLTILRLPHYGSSQRYRLAQLMPHYKEGLSMKSLKMRDGENFTRLKSGCQLIAYGWRKSDSIQRAIVLKENQGFDTKGHRIHPCWQWSTKDVFAYMRQKKLPLPINFGQSKQTAFSLKPAPLFYVKQNFPDDWRKVLAVFPYAEVMVKKYESRKPVETSKVRNAADRQNLSQRESFQSAPDLQCRQDQTEEESSEGGPAPATDCQQEDG